MKKNVFSSEKPVSLAGKNVESDKSADSASISEKEKENNDYWERIAEDPASGYKNEVNNDPLLNVDQEPGDNQISDKAQ